MKNFHSGGGDPLERLLSTEAWKERVGARRGIKATISAGNLVLIVTLPAEGLFGILENIEQAGTLSRKLKIIAEELARVEA